MTRFQGGPADGLVLGLRRIPIYLRVVRDPEGLASPWDALDQLDDRPRPRELIFAYRQLSDDGIVHVDGTDRRGRRFGEWLHAATYEFIEVQPAADILRSTELWRAWCYAEHAKAKAKAKATA